LCPSLPDALVAPHPDERHCANQIAHQHVSVIADRSPPRQESGMGGPIN
jgi:hypothetical protein